MKSHAHPLASLSAMVLVCGMALAQPPAAPSKPAIPAPPAAPTVPAAPKAPATPAAPVKAAADMPSGAEILKKYVEATGGKAAYEKLKNRVGTGSFDLAGAMKGTVKTVQTDANKGSMVLEVANMGTIQRGTDGTHSWESSKFGGSKLLNEKDFQQEELFLPFNAEIRADKVFSKLDCVGIEKVGEADCYKVEMTCKSGSKTVGYYNKTTGLLDKRTLEEETPQGPMTAVMMISDYKDVGGVKVAHKLELSSPAQPAMKQVITFEKFESNAELASDAFTPPAEIKALIEKEGKKDAEPKKEEPRKDTEPKKTEPAKR